MYLTSCKKENLIPENEQVSSDVSDTSLILRSLGDAKNGVNQLVFEPEFGVTEALGMLVFRSSEDYWNTVQTEDIDKLERFINLIENMEYTSFEDAIVGDQTKKDTLYTGLMPKMINDKEEIIIGRNIYKINMHEEKVYTMPAAAINEINELHIQNALNKKIKAYSTHADVIDVVEKKIGCGEGCEEWSVSAVREGRSGYGSKEFEFKMKLKYFHFGIGTDMDANLDILDQQTVTTTTTWNSTTNKWETKTDIKDVEAADIYLFGVMARKYKVKCGNESPWYQMPVEYKYGTSMTIQSYNLRKCLAKYEATANFQYKFLSTDSYHYFDPADSDTYPLFISRGY